MKAMKKELFDELSNRTRKLLETKEAGTSTRDLMASLYADSLEGKTIEQGLLMSGEALEALRGFHRDYAAAVKDPEEVSEKLVGQLTEGQEETERLKILKRLYAGVTASNAKLEGADQAQIDALLRQAEEEPAAGAETESEIELREKVIEALRGSSLIQRGLERQADELEELASEYSVDQLVMQIGDDEEAFEGILTILAYVASKKGCKELPPDLTMQETACVVAAAVEEQHIARRVATGELAANAAAVLLGILGTVLVLRVALHILAFGASLASMFGVLTAIPAFILLVTTVGVAVAVAVTLWVRALRVAARTAPKLVRTAVKVVTKGLRKLGVFIKSTAAPIATDLAVKALAFLEGKPSQKETVENTVKVKG